MSIKTIVLFSFLLFAITCIIGHPPSTLAKDNNGNTNDNVGSGSGSKDKTQKEDTVAAPPKEDMTAAPPKESGTTAPAITTDQIPIEPPVAPIPEVNCSKTPDIPPCPPVKQPSLPKFIIPPAPSDDDLAPVPKPDTTTTSHAKTNFTHGEFKKMAGLDKNGNPTNFTQDVVTPPPQKGGPDNSCQFFPEQEKCKPDPVTHQCPPGFNLNEGEHCFPSGKCPDGFGRVDDDETGSCVPKNSNSPKLICPPDVSPNNAKHCVDHCPTKSHESHGLCVPNDVHKRIIVIHRTKTIHISSNNNPSSMVTRDTKITPELNVGEAIDGCKDVNNKSSSELQKSCDIFMAATFNYCMTHQSIANKDQNICSDPLYDNVAPYLKTNKVDMKLFPSAIYNITP